MFKFLFKLFFVVFLAGVLGMGGYIWMKILQSRLETAFTETLTQEGLGPQHIGFHTNEEKHWGPVQWVTTRRVIEGTTTQNLPEDLKSRLKAAFEKVGGTIIRDEEQKEEWRLEAGKGPLVFQIVVGRKGKGRSPSPDQVPIKWVALVIDDVGYSTAPLKAFLALGIPLTFAILPGERHSKDLARAIHEAGHEVILHLPLEPEGYPTVNPGSRALLTSMRPREIRKKFLENLRSVPHVTGVSNHMGSAFTAHGPSLKNLLQAVKGRDIFFFDSHTSQKSEVPHTAQELRLPWAQNDVFLDNEDNPAAIAKQLFFLASVAAERGQATGIGHFSRKYLAETIKEAIPTFQAEGTEFVTLSTYIKRKVRN